MNQSSPTQKILSEERLKLVQRMLRERGLGADTANTAPPLVARRERDDLPTSFAQRRLWFIDRVSPGSPAYNLPAAYRIRGALDQTLIQRCLDQLIERHETLRTAFVDIDGSPRLHIHESITLDLPFLDLSNAPRDELARRLREALDHEIHRPFRLDVAPLFRILLIRCSPDDHVLSIVFHHIISDAWSLEVFRGELQRIYAGLQSGNFRGTSSPTGVWRSCCRP